MKPFAYAIAASTLLMTACGGGETHSTRASNAPPVAVQTVAAAAREWSDAYEATGTVRARTTAVLSSKVMAYVQQVSAQIGDRVREGQTLITLDPRDQDAAVRQAEAAVAEVQSAVPEADSGIAAAKANLDLAQATFKRIEGLAEKKSVSNQELDEASARLKSAIANHEMARGRRAQLDSKLAQAQQAVRTARIALGYATIAAPFSGIVSAKSVEPGNLAAPGAPLLTIEREGGYRLEASVEESRLPLVKIGQTVEMELESAGRRVSGRVSEIVPSVDSASRTNTVKIDLPSLPNLRTGMFGRAFFPAGSRKAVAVPAAALVERGQLQSVFVVEDGAAHMRLVTTGTRRDGAVETLSGLSDGEVVVSPAPANLADGARVEVRK